MKEFTRRDAIKVGFAVICASAMTTVGIEALDRRIGERDSKKLDELKKELEELKKEQKADVLGDCINENILREAMGAEPISPPECVEERNEWLKKWEELQKSREGGQG